MRLLIELLTIVGLNATTIGVMAIDLEFEINLGGFAGYAEFSWVVLPGESPIRSSLQSLNSGFFIDPQLSIDWKVKRSSLIAEAVVTTEPVEISDRVWFSNPDGLALLKSVYEQFTKGFPPCEMHRTEDEEIYFTFDRDSKVWRVQLPNDDFYIWANRREGVYQD